MTSKKTVTRRRRIAKRNGSTKIQEKKITKKEEELTADELILRAWKKTYENRHRRLDA
ncbi:MAG TPA: hypothetical protein VEZ90_12595 [Blastocatellia bacterium]|nr:hypothetical protein [Blastocatellia bacterium]